MSHSNCGQGCEGGNISIDLILNTLPDRTDPLYFSRDSNPRRLSEQYKSPFPYSGYSAKPILDDLGRVLIYAVSKDLVRAGPADAEHPAYRTTMKGNQLELYSDTFLNR